MRLWTVAILIMMTAQGGGLPPTQATPNQPATVTTETAAPPSTETCPVYSYPDKVPFGASLEDVEQTFKVPGCSFKQQFSPGIEVINDMELPIQRYRDGLSWWLGYPVLPERLITSRVVSCQCWKATSTMALYFSVVDGGVSRLMFVVKSGYMPSFNMLSSMAGEINKKAGFNGKPIVDYTHERGYAPEQVTGYNWDGKTQDLYLYGMANAITMFQVYYSLNVSKSEWSKHVEAFNRAIKAQETRDQQRSKAAATEF